MQIHATVAFNDQYVFYTELHSSEGWDFFIYFAQLVVVVYDFDSFD